MRAIAQELEAGGDRLITVAMGETNLPEARLRNERARTMFQLTSYAAACERDIGWKPESILLWRKRVIPISGSCRCRLVRWLFLERVNFPFAYSTAGGDTASALAAGCPVIVKAHPAHAETSEIVAQAIARSVEKAGLPKGVFAHVHGAGFETGKALVTHTYTRAVGFTGSYGGGKALFDWANQRSMPIPVFAEMGSINPVFLLPGKLRASAKELAAQLAGLITLGTGQFCTNPGLILGIEGEELDGFVHELGTGHRKGGARDDASSGYCQSVYGKTKRGAKAGECRYGGCCGYAAKGEPGCGDDRQRQCRGFLQKSPSPSGSVRALFAGDPL